MRIALISHPLQTRCESSVQLAPRQVWLALQVLAQEYGQDIEAELIDAHSRWLDRFDVLHVFGADGSNHALIETAAARGVPLVLSPLIAPGWNHECGALARESDHRFGKRMARSAHSSYAQTRRALQLANTVAVWGERERDAVVQGFLINEAKIQVCAPGIHPSYFLANGDLFRQRTGLQGPFILVTGPISPYHNQLGMVQALSGLDLPIVLLGEVRERDQAYLQQIRAQRGVTCIGGLQLDSKMLASAYAGATALVLPDGECMVHALLAALATGTPVIVEHSSPLAISGSELAVCSCKWDSGAAASLPALTLLRKPPAREQVRALVRQYSWERTALAFTEHYRSLAHVAKVLTA
jgi:glycosyltransferase involved in cell wall biosynthesis